MYQLSSELNGHIQDVKAIVAIDNNRLVSSSRDGTVRIWTRETTVWENKVIYKADKFINSICFEGLDNLVFCGGQEDVISGISPFLSSDQVPVYTLVGHVNNVCSLDSKNGWVISGSWDKTAKIWYHGVLKYELKGHTAAVWDAKIFPEGNRFITVSADQTIKIWEGSKLIKSFDHIHQDVIRHIALNPEGTKFATCSNDGTIKLCDINGNLVQTFIGHESFVYCVKFTSEGNLISCSEDRSVRIWSIDGNIIQIIMLPAISVWSIDILPNNDIAIGTSDALIRIFTQDQQRYASVEQIKRLNDQTENFTINAKTVDFDESKLSPFDILQQKGKKEGQIVVVKTPFNMIEAHQFSQGKWVKVGDVVGSPLNDQKVEFEGNKYDYVFDVDIQEGVPPLKLPFNSNDNPYDVADHFITRYELPLSYKEQIVQFLIKNTSHVMLDHKNYKSVKKQKVFPVNLYLSIATINPESLMKGIIKLNTNEKIFNDHKLTLINDSLHDVDKNWKILYSNALIIRDSWKTPTLAYDIIRLIIDKLPCDDSISEFMVEGLDSKDIVLKMMTIRILVNCFKNDKWGLNFMSSENVYSSVFQNIDTEYSTTKQSLLTNIAIGISTLIFNYSVLILNKPEINIISVLIDSINNKFGSSSLIMENEEASYRLLVAYGNLTIIKISLRQSSTSLPWIQFMKTKYGHLPRFNSIFYELSG